jgi:hypothetical protein
MSGKGVAVELQVMLYLLEGVCDGLLPDALAEPDAAERMATFRIFCYSPCALWVPPTVRAKYTRVSDPAARARHHEWARLHLEEDVAPGADESELAARADALRTHHDDVEGCRVVAEAEAVGVDVLMTSDEELIRNLRAHTALSLLKPSEFFISLGIPPGTKPPWLPPPGNPLRDATSWRI